MGSQCCKPQIKEVGISDIQLKKPTTTAHGLALTKSLLYISDNINNVLSKSGRSLNCTFLPGNREYGDSSLILPMRHSDPKLFVRFYLIYSFYIARYNSKQTDFQSIFYNLASKTHQSEEEKKKLQEFKIAYSSEKNQLKKDLIVVSYVFSARFIIQNINQILLSSNDPKDIAHLIFPLARIYNGIKKTFQTNRQKKPNTLFIIAQLRGEQKKLIKEMIGKQCCFSFSVFMKGFTVQSHARKQFNKIKQQNSGNSQKITFFFTVNFPYKADKMESKYDYGFYVNPDKDSKSEGDVLFNIMNSFKVVEAFSESEYDLEYGYLPYIYYAKYTDRTPNIETSSIRVFDVCEAVSTNYLKSQSCLFRIIKEGMHSLKISQTIISQPPSKSNLKQELNQVQVENMINNYVDESNFNEALSLANKYKSSYLIQARKLQILYKKQQFAEARKFLNEIGPPPARGQKKITQAEEIIQFISAKLLIDEGKNEKAKQKLKALHLKMMKKYEAGYEIIGAQVVSALEELYSGSKEKPITSEVFNTQRQARETIEKSQINLRGISTTI